MDVATAVPTGGSRGTTSPRGGARTYGLLLWPLQFLAGLTTSVATLSIMLASDAYSPFETGSTVLLAIGYGLTYTAFSPASPLGGRLTDRQGPQQTLVGSNAGYLAVMAFALLLQGVGYLPGLLAWVLLLSRVACQSVQLTALDSSIPALLPKRLFSNANGSRLLVTAVVAGSEAPIASALEPSLGLAPIILVAVAAVTASFLVARRAGFPAHPPARPVHDAVTGPDAVDRGYRPVRAYIRSRPGLTSLLVCWAALNFVLGYAEVALTSITNGFGSSATPNLVLGIGLVGMLAASAWITVRGTPRDLVRRMFGASLVLGGALVIGSTGANVVATSLGALLFLGAATFVMATLSTLIHVKTEPGLMGRMMGLKTLCVGLFYGAGNVVGALCAGFVRKLVGGNPAVSTGFLTHLVGTGRSYGRGYAVVTMAVGVLVVASVVLARRHAPLREVDTDLPDTTEEDLPAVAVPGRAVGQQSW
ncbi:MFS transporter [Streptomyces sp. NPDC021020]|uniref:MFS transporter n=1 Tax=Streptomyces sp. NPDC021020 TaxID=3365109 RepID=UPI0037AD0BC0